MFPTARPPKRHTYLDGLDGVSDEQLISDWIGLVVPSDFVKVVRAIRTVAIAGKQEPAVVMNDILGMTPANEDDRYFNTPAELFPFASTHCDGDHYGFLVLAPEVASPDFPIAHLCPMDSDGVVLVGGSVRVAISLILARTLNWSRKRADFEQLRSSVLAVANHLGWEPVDNEPPAISIPIGWRLVPTSDGVGVLAPVEAFSKAPLRPWEFGLIDEFVAAAKVAIASRHFGSALYFLRQAYWFAPSGWQGIGKLMCEAYVGLGRVLLAQVWDRSLKKLEERMPPFM